MRGKIGGVLTSSPLRIGRLAVMRKAPSSSGQLTRALLSVGSPRSSPATPSVAFSSLAAGAMLKAAAIAVRNAGCHARLNLEAGLHLPGQDGHAQR